MAVRFPCSCGTWLEVGDSPTAREVRCPVCGRQVTVPASPGEVKVAEDSVDSAGPLLPTETVAPEEDRSLAAVPTRDWRRRAEEIAAEHRRILQRFTVWRACLESLAFPIRGRAGWYTLLLPTLMVIAGEIVSLIGSRDIRAALLGVVAGPLALAVAAVFNLGWLGEVSRSAVAGPTHPPDWGGCEFIAERLIPGLKMLVHLAAVVVAPSLLAGEVLKAVGLVGTAERPSPLPLSISPVVLVVALGVLVFYYPMALAAMSALERFLAGLNPLVVGRAILRVPVEYAVSVAFAAGLVGGALTVMGVLEEVFPETARLLWPWLAYYSLCVAVSRVGFLVYRKRYRLGWSHVVGHRPAEMSAAPAPPTLTEEGTAHPTDQWVRFTCPCGRLLRVPFAVLGGVVTCPACGRRLLIPGTQPEERGGAGGREPPLDWRN